MHNYYDFDKKLITTYAQLLSNWYTFNQPIYNYYDIDIKVTYWYITFSKCESNAQQINQ